MEMVLWHWWMIMMAIMSAGGETLYTDCGGTLKDPRGIIATPNFPKEYPIPISCRWVIEAPVNKVIAIYFTQFYMREGVKLTEYAFFADNFFAGKHEFDPISSDNKPTYLLTNKPILVFEFAVREIGNIHLRIREYFLDVFGFNITYEIMDKAQTVRKDGCINHHCSYTGKCFAEADYHSYYCDCFDTYFGDECQHSPVCGPSGNLIACQNGGTCRYYIGSTTYACDCLPSFEGRRCEKRKDLSEFGCAKYGCSHSCLITSSGDPKCTCPQEYKLEEDGKSCVQQGRTRFVISFKIYDQNMEFLQVDSTKYKHLKKSIENANKETEKSTDCTHPVLTRGPTLVTNFLRVGVNRPPREVRSNVTTCRNCITFNTHYKEFCSFLFKFLY